MRGDKEHGVHIFAATGPRKKTNRLAEGDIAGETLRVTGKARKFRQTQFLAWKRCEPLGIKVAAFLQRVLHSLHIPFMLRVKPHRNAIALLHIKRTAANIEKANGVFRLPRHGLSVAICFFIDGFAARVQLPIRWTRDAHHHVAAPCGTKRRIFHALPRVGLGLFGIGRVAFINTNAFHVTNIGQHAWRKTCQHNAAGQHKLACAAAVARPTIWKNSVPCKSNFHRVALGQRLGGSEHPQARAIFHVWRHGIRVLFLRLNGRVVQRPL